MNQKYVKRSVWNIKYQAEIHQLEINDIKVHYKIEETNHQTP